MSNEDDGRVKRIRFTESSDFDTKAIEGPDRAPVMTWPKKVKV